MSYIPKHLVKQKRVSITESVKTGTKNNGLTKFKLK